MGESSPERSLPALIRHFSLRGLLLLAGLLIAFWLPSSVSAQDVAQQPTTERGAWLVTYAPGSVYWQRFGHNAIWLKLPERGIDHLFNYGYFDFQQPNFLGRFIKGRMLYMAAASTPEQEFYLYETENRGIQSQRLNLTEPQLTRLAEHLLTDIQPENRDYRYDYFLDNCSTRIRDALDHALDGALSSTLTTTPASNNFRSHVNSLSAGDYWLSLGLAIGLGSPVDEERSAFEESFIPGVLSEQVASLQNPSTGARLGGPVEVLYTGETEPRAGYQQPWLRYLLLGLGITLGFWLVLGIQKQARLRRMVVALCLVLGLPGLLLAFLAFLTDHSAAASNINLLLFNPLYLLLAFTLLGHIRSRRWVTVIATLLLTAWVAGFLLGTPVMKWQDNAAVLALTAPMAIMVVLGSLITARRARQELT